MDTSLRVQLHGRACNFKLFSVDLSLALILQVPDKHISPEYRHIVHVESCSAKTNGALPDPKAFKTEPSSDFELYEGTHQAHIIFSHGLMSLSLHR